MSADIPDPRTLESWEDAFKYPVVTVRGMERKLRRDMDENHEKLRTLVGASYRDLLDTARTIIDVNGQMEKVETLLVDIGRRSDSRILDKIAANHAKLERVARAQDTAQLALVSQLSVLQKCLNVIARILKGHGSTLLVAKLLVIARLLHKTTSSSAGAPPLCKTLGVRLGSLRERLLRHIDRRLAKRTNDPTTLVEDMTAFSLATSSTPSDVLKHFQHLRFDAICRPLLTGEDNIKESIVRRIRAFLSTIRDSSAIYPEVFAASLRALGARPLVEDASVTAIEELSFDIHQRWFASDVKNYAPYTRHDELNRSKAEQMFSDWSSQTASALTERIGKDVADETDLRAVVEVRRETLQLWLSSRRDARGLDWNRVFDDLRAPFIQQITHLVEEASAELHDSICISIISNAENWGSKSSSQSTTSLWDIDSLTTDISDGAQIFRQTIVDKRFGRHQAVNQLLEIYQRSASTLEKVHTNIKAMRDTRWEDNHGDLDDDDDDNVTASNVLSKTDPEELQSTLHQRLLHTVELMQSSLSTQLGQRHLDCSKPDSPGLFVVRALRELRQLIPQFLQHVNIKAAHYPFCQDLVIKLQCSLATAVSSQTEPTFSTALDRFVQSRHSVQSLWVGTPGLPVQPTPATFRYLRSVVKQMEMFGQDLWSLDAVSRLRQAQAVTLGELLRKVIQQLEEQATVREEQVTATEEQVSQISAGEQQSTAEEAQATTTEENQAPAAEAQATIAEEHEPAADVQHQASTPETRNKDENVANTTTNTDESQEPQSEPGNTPTQEEEVQDSQPSANESTSENPTTQEPATEETAPTAPEATAPTSSITTPRAAKTKQPILQTAAKHTQLLFDTLYLSEAFPPSTAAESSDGGVTFDGLVAELIGKANVDDAAEQRVRKAAREYWRRTYLLFGLLVAE